MLINRRIAATSAHPCCTLICSRPSTSAVRRASDNVILSSYPAALAGYATKPSPVNYAPASRAASIPKSSVPPLAYKATAKRTTTLLEYKPTKNAARPGGRSDYYDDKEDDTLAMIRAAKIATSLNVQPDPAQRPVKNLDACMAAALQPNTASDKPTAVSKEQTPIKMQLKGRDVKALTPSTTRSPDEVVSMRVSSQDEQAVEVVKSDNVAVKSQPVAGIPAPADSVPYKNASTMSQEALPGLSTPAKVQRKPRRKVAHPSPLPGLLEHVGKTPLIHPDASGLVGQSNEVTLQASVECKQFLPFSSPGELSLSNEEVELLERRRRTREHYIREQEQWEREREQREKQREQDAALERALLRRSYLDYKQLFEDFRDARARTCSHLASLRYSYYRETQTWRKQREQVEQLYLRLAGDAPFQDSVVTRLEEIKTGVGSILADLSELEMISYLKYRHWDEAGNEMVARITAFATLSHQSRMLTRRVRYHALPEYGGSDCWAYLDMKYKLFLPTDYYITGLKAIWKELRSLDDWKPPANPYRLAGQYVTMPDTNGKDVNKTRALGGRQYGRLVSLADRAIARAFTLRHLVTGMDGVAELKTAKWLQHASLIEKERYRVMAPFKAFQISSAVFNMAWRDFKQRLQKTRQGIVPEPLHKLIQYMDSSARSTSRLILSGAIHELEVLVYKRATAEYKSGVLQDRAAELQKWSEDYLDEIRRRFTRKGPMSEYTPARRSIGKHKSAERTRPRPTRRVKPQLATRARVSKTSTAVVRASLLCGKSDGRAEAPELLRKVKRAKKQRERRARRAKEQRERKRCGYAEPEATIAAEAGLENTHPSDANMTSQAHALDRRAAIDERAYQEVIQNGEASGISASGLRPTSPSSRLNFSPSPVLWYSQLTTRSAEVVQEKDRVGLEEEEEEGERLPLSYQIPVDDLKKAMLASASSGAAYWRHTMYRGPQGQQIAVHYCRSKQTSERVAQNFLDKDVLGFDVEWKPNALPFEGVKSNVSLIQLACEDRIALFHLSLHKGDTAEDLLAHTLKKILESPNTMKVGVAIKADFSRVRKYLGVEPRGVFELSHLYKLVKYCMDSPEKVNKVAVSLARQVEEHLQLPLFKGQVRESDWSKALTYEQIQYAASDAYAGFRLYDILEAKRFKLKPTPPRPYFVELNHPIRLAPEARILGQSSSTLR